jgi:hypothetical protein
MNNEPEQIRQKVERSRAELSSDVNALADKVDPRQVVGRRVNRARGAFQRAKETIMGSAESARRTADVKAGEMSERAYGAMSSMEQKADQATDQVRETASSMQQAASSVPDMARQRTEGSPLAAGLIAFGAGVLVSSLLPRSGPEQQVAGRVKQTASEHSGQLKQAATGTAQHVRDDLRGPTQQAVESVKSSAGEAASKVRDEGRSAGRDVKEQTQRARQNVSPNRG